MLSPWIKSIDGVRRRCSSGDDEPTHSWSRVGVALGVDICRRSVDGGSSFEGAGGWNFSKVTGQQRWDDRPVSSVWVCANQIRSASAPQGSEKADA